MAAKLLGIASGLKMRLLAIPSTTPAMLQPRPSSGHKPPQAPIQFPWLQRAELPELKGLAELRRRSQAPSDGQYPEAVHIRQPKSRIQRDGQNPLLGITNTSEAWRVRDNFYGNQKMFVASVVERLLAVKLAQGPLDSLEQICQVIQAAISTLRAVEADSCLENDQRLVATFVAKLPNPYTKNWDKHNAITPPRNKTTWRKFVGWALGMREAFNAARTREE